MQRVAALRWYDFPARGGYVKRYSLFHPLLLSFYSPSLYRDVAENWKGVGLLYLLLLLALAWIWPIVHLQRSTAALLEALGPAVLAQVPTVSIHQGEVSIQEPQPYVIAVPGSDTPLAVIDTTGQTTPQNSQAMLILTKNQAIVRKNLHETRIYDLSEIRDLTVDRSSVAALLDACKRWMGVVAYPLALLGSYLYRIVQVLIYAGIGLLFVRLLDAALEYPELLRLSCVAITPAVVADTLRAVAGYPSSPLWWLACFLISMGYLLFAVKANAPGGSGREAAGPPEQRSEPTVV